MNKIPWFSHDNTAHQDLKLRHVMREHGGLKAYGLYWVLLEVLDLHGGGDVVSVPIADLETMTMSKRGYILTAAQAMAGVDLIQITESARGLFSYEIKKFRERQSKMKSKIRSFPSKTPLDVDVDVDLEKRERDGHVSAGALNNSPSDQPNDDGFEDFWASYPREVVEDKPAALRVWKTLAPDERLRSDMLEGLMRMSTTRKWEQENGRFIPNPSQWLSEEGWTDETWCQEFNEQNVLEEEASKHEQARVMEEQRARAQAEKKTLKSPSRPLSGQRTGASEQRINEWRKRHAR